MLSRRQEAKVSVHIPIFLRRGSKVSVRTLRILERGTEVSVWTLEFFERGTKVSVEITDCHRRCGNTVDFPRFLSSLPVKMLIF